MTEEQELLLAGVVGSTVAIPFIKQDTDILQVQAGSATIEPGGEVEITVDITNTASINQDYYIGATITRPDGQSIDIRSERVNLRPGQDGTAVLGPTSTGSLSPISGGPDEGIQLFPVEGNYDLTVGVFNRRVDDSGGSFGNVLEDRVADEDLSNAINVQVQADADVVSIEVNGNQVV